MSFPRWHQKSLRYSDADGSAKPSRLAAHWVRNIALRPQPREDERLLVHGYAGKETLARPPAVPAVPAVPGIEDEDEDEDEVA